MLAGARWALATALDTIFGDAIGAALTDAVLTNVERWTGTGWVPIA